LETLTAPHLQKIGDKNSWNNHFSAEEYEEMTDVAERLRAPMDHAIRFQNRNGQLYCASSVDQKDLLTISREAEVVARKVAETNLAWAMEAVRRHAESLEIETATSLPIGATMAVFSPTPDDVLDGSVNIGGYNLDKKTTMVRVWSNTENGLDCRYISLDGGNRAALRAAAAAIGREMPAQYGSEEILSTFYQFDSGEPDIAERIIGAHDEYLKQQTGQDFSYGRAGLNHKKALDIAAEHPARLAEHMAEIQRLKWSYSGEALDKKMEEARFNYAAALDRTERGEAVSSNSSAGDSARAGGENFAGFCAASPNANDPNAPNSAQEALNKLFGVRKVTGKCPCCKEITTYDPCDPVCGECGSDGTTDRSAEYFARKKLAAKQRTTQQTMGAAAGLISHRQTPDLPWNYRVKLTEFGLFKTTYTVFDSKDQAIATGKGKVDAIAQVTGR
jgi:hypothetical protein